MAADMQLLSATPLFAGIGPEAIPGMLRCLNARTQSYRRDEWVLRAGERAAAMGLVLAGSVLVVHEDFWGNRNLLARVDRGHLFGESFACRPEARLNVDVIAEEKTETLWLDASRVTTACGASCPCHAQLIRNLVSVLAGKNLAFNDKLRHMGQRTTREKLLSYLSAQAEKSGSAAFDIPFDRQELADYLAVERSAMSAELGCLRDEGLLTFRKNHFRLCGGLPEDDA